jgi:hypothetical protein
MPAAPLDIVVEQGTTWRYAMDIKDAGGIPVDLSARSGEMHVRRTPKSPLILELTTANGRILITPGKIELRLDPADTSPLRAGTYVYDLELTEPGGSGAVSRLIEGTFTLTPEVTHG